MEENYRNCEDEKHKKNVISKKKQKLHDQEEKFEGLIPQYLTAHERQGILDRNLLSMRQEKEQIMSFSLKKFA